MKTINRSMFGIAVAGSLTMLACAQGNNTVKKTATVSAPVKQPAQPDADDSSKLKGDPVGEWHLAQVSNAPTERATIARVTDFARHVLSDKRQERIGLSNYGAIDSAIKDNPNLQDTESVRRYFFDVSDIYPTDCTPIAHARVKERINHMIMVARACDQEGLVGKLKERQTMLDNTRATLDEHAICLGVK